MKNNLIISNYLYAYNKFKEIFLTFNHDSFELIKM